MSSFGEDLRCPDDGHLLQPNKDAPGFAACRHCDGVWLSRAALENGGKLPFREVSTATAPITARAARTCPQCSAELKMQRIDDVSIDICLRCAGVWLDPGEYRAARKYVTEKRLQRAMPTSMREPSFFEDMLELVVEFCEDISVRRYDEDDDTPVFPRRR